MALGKKIFVALALVSGFAAAEASDWSSSDSALLGTAVTGLAVDWAQTRYIATGHGYHETNGVLGSQPSVGRVNTYFVASIAGTVGLALWMPAKPRRLFLGSLAAVEIGLVLHNQSIGIQARY